MPKHRTILMSAAIGCFALGPSSVHAQYGGYSPQYSDPCLELLQRRGGVGLLLRVGARFLNQAYQLYRVGRLAKRVLDLADAIQRISNSVGSSTSADYVVNDEVYNILAFEYCRAGLSEEHLRQDLQQLSFAQKSFFNENKNPIQSPMRQPPYIARCLVQYYGAFYNCPTATALPLGSPCLCTVNGYPVEGRAQ